MTFDDGWVPHFAACAASIASSKGPESVRIIVLQGPALSDTAVDDIRKYVHRLELEFEVLTIPRVAFESLPPTQLFAPMVWYRLLLPSLLPQDERVLALDVDTLVLQSLLPLYEQALGEDFIAGVATPIAGDEPKRRSALGLDPRQPYFNAGVMVMNLDAMRAERLGPRAIALGHERNSELLFAEQDALNILASGRWRLLHPRWNALSYTWLLPLLADGTYTDIEIDSARHSPAIVHFEGFQTVKPWFYRSVHPLRFLYMKFRNQTPWPLEGLERRTATGMVLRRVPYRWQYALSRAKAKMLWMRTR